MASKKTAQQPDANDGVFWRTLFKGIPIRLELRDLSVQRLRQAKQYFGEQYAIPSELIRLLLLGEADAMTIAVWIGLQKAKKWPIRQDGRDIEDPRHLDFNLDEDFEALEDPQPPAPEKKDRPTKTTAVSAETGPASATDTSSGSDPS